MAPREVVVSVPGPRPPASLPRRIYQAAAEAGELFAGATVRVVLWLSWVAILVVVALAALGLPDGSTFFLVGRSRELETGVAVGLVAFPKVLTWCLYLLLSGRANRLNFGLLVPERPSDGPAAGWAELRDRAMTTWSYEAGLTGNAMDRASQHASMFGLLTSLSLACCALVVLRGERVGAFESRPFLLAVSIAATTVTSFAISLGVILFRIAGNDVTARMLASASRTLLLLVIASFLFSAILLQLDPGEQRLVGPLGAVAIGVGVGLLGEVAVRAAKERAASVLGVVGPAAHEASPLKRIEGMTDEDVARLAEEGVDSIHALAFLPTPRLFFNTTHSLQRICDWQDQALLLEYMGPVRAQILREHFMIRGVIDAQWLARTLLDLDPGRAGLIEPNGRGQDAARWHEERERIFQMLGFASAAQARTALGTLPDDETINRVRLYWQSTPVQKDGA